MPLVMIIHRGDRMNRSIKQVIGDAVCHFGAKEFSTVEATLSTGDFTIKFDKVDSDDRMNGDVLLFVPLHHFPERIAKTSDGLAAGLAEFIRDALKEKGLGEGLSIGALVPLCDIGWATVTVS